MRQVDKRALRILSATYWSSSGWKKDHTTPPDDLAHARSARMMFDPKHLSHDESVLWALRSRDQVSKSQVVSGFIASLTSRRLDWRSALGSYAVSLNLPFHSFTKNGARFWCPICAGHDSGDRAEDLNVLNFERFKWGGVRHTNPVYIGFDLEQFLLDLPVQPSDADVKLLKKMLGVAGAMPRKAKLSDLAKQLTGIVSSNLSERRALIEILGYCGILQDPSKPSFLDGFPPHSSRPEVPWRKNDWSYPVQWWNGSCGVNNDAVTFWFPNL
jgi:hypothetical protein